jgi:hypothetical protein
MLRRGGRIAEKESQMEGLILISILIYIGYAIYKCGKRAGSRKGYGVGRAHGRRRS